jgi:hypothetical protein
MTKSKKPVAAKKNGDPHQYNRGGKMKKSPEQKAFGSPRRPWKTMEETAGVFYGKRFDGKIMDFVPPFQKGADGPEKTFAKAAGMGAVIGCQNYRHCPSLNHR